MQIDIQPAKYHSGWFVIAHCDFGDCHDFFQTNEEAVAFAIGFYGGTLVEVKPIPKTANQKCLEYGTTEDFCGCPDYTKRGGSYTHKGERMCKHIAHMRDIKI